MLFSGVLYLGVLFPFLIHSCQPVFTGSFPLFHLLPAPLLSPPPPISPQTVRPQYSVSPSPLPLSLNYLTHSYDFNDRWTLLSPRSQPAAACLLSSSPKHTVTSQPVQTRQLPGFFTSTDGATFTWMPKLHTRNPPSEPSPKPGPLPHPFSHPLIPGPLSMFQLVSTATRFLPLQSFHLIFHSSL